MGILGNVGSLYMAVLMILVVLGFGMLGLWFVDAILDGMNQSDQTNEVRKERNIDTK